jgi:hypothetical protein
MRRWAFLFLRDRDQIRQRFVVGESERPSHRLHPIDRVIARQVPEKEFRIE